MYVENFDRSFFDALVWFVFVTGVIAAVVRLYMDFSRPLPPSPDDDTKPNPTQANHPHKPS